MSKTLISILSGLGGMFGWGTSDFFANLSADKVGNVKAFFWSQLAGALLIFLTALFVLPSFDLPLYLVPLVIISSIGYVSGYLFFYKAFEVGNVSVASVVINLNAVFTMLVAFFLFGQKLIGWQIPGVILIILGVLFASVDFRDLFKGKGDFLLAGAKEALLASIGFGIFHWPLTDIIVERTNWLWYALLVKLISLLVVFVYVRYKSLDLKINSESNKVITSISLVGVLEALAVLSVMSGLTIGDSILISPIANSVAVVTVTMAVIFLKEKITKLQTLGIAATVIGIVLTSF